MTDAPGSWASEAALQRQAKSADAFRTISEVSGELAVPQHVLRFWETKFPQVKPLKRAGGRRYYRPEDVTLLATIRDLLYREGFTIKGAQKHLRGAVPKGSARAADEASEASVKPGSPTRPVGAPASGDAERPKPDRAALKGVLDELEALRKLLRS
ncbi:MAG TPA: MerR family transcriptional regulator [Alphaproteobacteria bacterium]|nr:MerR family transcriptional regulator [Alphaproteobacteria bacterium]